MQFLTKEDIWANIIGLFLVISVSMFWYFDGFWIAKIFSLKLGIWNGLDVSAAFVKVNLLNFSLLFLFFLVWFMFVTFCMRKNIKSFFASFCIIYLLSVVVFLISSHSLAQEYQLETPLIALLIGLCIGNFIQIPQWFRESLMTEFYVKIGIVLMGATLPLTLIVSAGGVAILQACIITIITFWSIYFIATKCFKLESPFAATLSAGGSICGVSAAIVIGNASLAKKEHISVTISIVVVWAVVMVFVLPFMCRLLDLDAGVAGAWIGTSEFADAAGLAAAQSLGDERTIAAFTLVKVIGRDMFVGVWAVLVAFLSVICWGKGVDKTKISAKIIWERFPKFIVGFIVASLIVSIFILGLNVEAEKKFNAEVISLLKTLRNWVFVWTFLCIGIGTRFKEIVSVGYKPFLAFTIGVGINLPLGFILSQYVFVDFWVNFME